MSNEIGKLGVLEGVFLEVRGDTYFEDFSAEEVEGLFEPRSTFAVGDAVEDVLGGFGVDDGPGQLFQGETVHMVILTRIDYWQLNGIGMHEEI